MPNRVHKDAFVPFHFELGLSFQEFVNDFSFDFHDFCFGFGFDGAFGWFSISEIVGVDNVAETSDEVEVVVLLLDTAGDNDVNGIYFLSLIDDFFAFFIDFLNRFHSDLDDLIASETRKQWAISQDIIKPNLISLELTEMNIYNASVDFLSQILKLCLIDEALLIVILEFLFFVI